MRIAIIPDIHGNGVALDAVLADLQQQAIDQIVCLGDAIQDGPQPAAVIQRLRDLACPVVMGNADAWLLSGEETGNEDISSDLIWPSSACRLTWTNSCASTAPAAVPTPRRRPYSISRWLSYSQGATSVRDPVAVEPV